MSICGGLLACPGAAPPHRGCRSESCLRNGVYACGCRRCHHKAQVRVSDGFIHWERHRSDSCPRWNVDRSHCYTPAMQADSRPLIRLIDRIFDFHQLLLLAIDDAQRTNIMLRCSAILARWISMHDGDDRTIEPSSLVCIGTCVDYLGGFQTSPINAPNPLYELLEAVIRRDIDITTLNHIATRNVAQIISHRLGRVYQLYNPVPTPSEVSFHLKRLIRLVLDILKQAIYQGHSATVHQFASADLIPFICRLTTFKSYGVDLYLKGYRACSTIFCLCF